MTLTATRFQYDKQEDQVEETIIEHGFSHVIDNLDVECQIRLGTLTLSVGELKKLKKGQVLQLNEKTSEQVDVILNQKIIARGELVCCDDYFGIKITELS